MKSTLSDRAKTELLPVLLSEMGVLTNAGRAASTTILENLLVLESKQRDYGPRNISVWGLHGVLVRLSDKIERLAHLMGQRRRKAQNESIDDTLRDIANYAVIAQLLRSGSWPQIEVDIDPPKARPVKKSFVSKSIPLNDDRANRPTTP